MHAYPRQARGNAMVAARALAARTRRTFFSVHIPRAPPTSTSRRRCPQLHTPARVVPLSLSRCLPPSLPSTSPSLSLSLSPPPPTTTSALPCFCSRNNLRHRTSRRLPSPRSSPSAVSAPRLRFSATVGPCPTSPAASSFARAVTDWISLSFTALTTPPLLSTTFTH